MCKSEIFAKIINIVSKEYLYTQIQKRIGLSTRSISYIINHTQKIDIKVIY